MITIFPATYSSLCPEALSVLIERNYSLSFVHCKLLSRGVGDTYLIESGTEKFALRVYRSSKRSLAQIKEEVKLLQALMQEGISVSYPIPNQSGEKIMTLNAVEGERYAVLFSYAPGQPVKVLSENQLRGLGREMARFHQLSAQIKPDGSRWKFDIATTLLRPLEVLKPALNGDPEVYEWLQKTVKAAAEKLTTVNAAGFTKGYCHFDFLPKNFHFQDDNITLFDFDFMGYGWLINDIMSFWQHLTLDVYTGRMTKTAAEEAYKIFLEAYRENRPLGELELSLVPYLSIGFWLYYMAFHTTHDQFLAFSQPAQVKAYIGVLKHIVDQHWQ